MPLYPIPTGEGVVIDSTDGGSATWGAREPAALYGFLVKGCIFRVVSIRFLARMKER
jgi:hypothetical protein